MDTLTYIAVLTASLLVGSRSSTELTRDYCLKENFDASCAENQVVVMTAARYGRMRIGNCAKQDYGHIGCHTDAINVMHALCSGRRRCSFIIDDSAVYTLQSTCPDDLVKYLEAGFTCVDVATGECNIQDTLILDAPSGNISSLISETRSTGTVRCPWVIRARPGQTIKLYMEVFGNGYSRCDELVRVRDGSSSESLTTCSETISTDSAHFMSKTSELTLHLPDTGSLATMPKYMVRYEVVGCADKPPIANATMTRDGNTLVIKCNKTNQSWTQACQDRRWIGEVRNCSQGPRSTDQPFPYGILVVVAIGVALGVFCGGLLLTCAAMYMKKRRRNAQHGDSHADPGDVFMSPDDHMRARTRSMADTMQRKQYPPSYYGRAVHCYDDACLQSSKGDSVTTSSPVCCTKTPVDVTQVTGTIRSHMYEAPRVV